MSNQNPTPPPPPTDPRVPHDPVVVERKSASPLIWILLLLALLAFGWYLYNQRGSVSSSPAPAAPPAVEIGDARDAAAERERAADEARQKAAREREAEPRTPVTRTPPSTQPDRAASPISRVEPTYPATAYRAREEGTVLVTADVDASGVPLSVEVARRSGSRALDQAAVAAVRQWRFEPAMRGGKAVASTVEVPVSFRIDR